VKADKRYWALRNAIKKFVKRGYYVYSETESSASLSKPSTPRSYTSTMYSGFGDPPVKVSVARVDIVDLHLDENDKVLVYQYGADRDLLLSRLAQTGEMIPLTRRIQLFTDLERLKRAYWISFQRFLRGKDAHFQILTATEQNREVFTLTGKFDQLTAHIMDHASWFGVGLNLSGPERFDRFDSLWQQRAEIESEIGSSLSWERRSQHTVCYVRLRGDGDPHDISEWHKQHAWMLEKLELFDRVFRPRIERL
jgi:hypothetical protein